MINTIKRTAIIATAVIFISGCGKSEQENKTALPAAKKTAVIQVDGKYLVTFIELGSENCMPCRLMKPVLKEIKEKHKTEVNVIYYDVLTNEGRPYAEMFGIEAIPVQIFFDKDGKEFFRHMGFFPYSEILKILNQKGVK